MMIYESLSVIYDRMINNFDYRGWYDQLHTILSTYNVKPNRVLDLGSGTGNFTGFLVSYPQVMALDPSRAMVELARKKVLAPNVNFVVGELKNLSPGEKFDVITMVNDGFHYVDDVVEFLDMVYHHLRDGGLFVCDLRNKEDFADNAGLYIEDEEDFYCVYEYSMEEELGVIDVTAFYLTGEDQYRRFSERHEFHFWETDELKSLSRDMDLVFQEARKLNVSLAKDIEDLRRIIVFKRR